MEDIVEKAKYQVEEKEKKLNMEVIESRWLYQRVMNLED